MYPFAREVHPAGRAHRRARSALSHALLVLLLTPFAVSAASGAVQPPPKNCTLPTCILGTDANGKWMAQPFTGGAGAQGPAGPQGPQGPAGPTGPQGIAGAAGVNGGPLNFKTYAGGNAITPNFWYGIDQSVTTAVAIALPAAGIAPWTNPAIVCFTNYGTGQTTFTSTSPLYGAPVFLGTDQTVCFGIDDQSPPGWRGDGGN